MFSGKCYDFACTLTNAYQDCVHCDAGCRWDGGQQIDFTLNIVFGTHKLRSKKNPDFGYLEFGIKRGEFVLEIKNGEMPVQSRKLTGSFNPNLASKRSMGTSDSNKSASDSGIKSSVGVEKGTPKASVEVSSSTNQDQETTQTQSDVFDHELSQIRSSGGPINPKWVFEVKSGEKVLTGHLGGSLGIINKKLGQTEILALFQVEYPHIVITEKYFSGNFVQKAGMKILAMRDFKRKFATGNNTFSHSKKVLI